MPDLDHDLAVARRDLLARIDIPELASLNRRANALRRRRSGAVASAVAAFLLFLGTGTMLATRAWLGVAEIQAGASPTDAGSLWRGGELTLHGLSGPVLDVPGEVRDVQFADAERGYALSADCSRGSGSGACAITVATTADGGRTWTTPAWLPSRFGEFAPDQMPSLLVLGSGVALLGSESWFASPPRGFVRTGAPSDAATTIPSGARLWLSGGSGDACDPRLVDVWLADGRQARLASQPDMDVCRVAPAPTASGAWWVGGTAGGQPAVGVSRDAGRSWQVSALPPAPTGAWAQVVTLGRDAFATVVSRRGGDPYPETLTIHAVYRSAAGGPFNRYVGDRDGTGGTLVGDVVPLLDGGLVAAGPGWQIAPGPGRDFAPAGGSLPQVYRLRRTPGAWVADRLFDAGWFAVSSDGASWRKINIV